MRVTYLVEKPPLEKLINKLMADSLILTLHPLSFLTASTQARQAFCFLSRGARTLLSSLRGRWLVGHEREEAECTCIRKPTMPTTMEGRRVRVLGREPGKPSLTALVSLYRNHSLARQLSLLP